MRIGTSQGKPDLTRRINHCDLGHYRHVRYLLLTLFPFHWTVRLVATKGAIAIPLHAMLDPRMGRKYIIDLVDSIMYVMARFYCSRVLDVHVYRVRMRIYPPWLEARMDLTILLRPS
ncbi:hypothetical protein M404DRAFT_885421 [Pisolithus tinctorius Marx 270]|uniref:Uncharacterized protein n=1 Tax=Pisolithus tinctorius Marx 270 TaxID=870435 RepID=A0A0C3NQE3_PISTI|nr:hypothetical protein M404DRAFT_885421 [Pisolithus tinctorius Marx 270]